MAGPLLKTQNSGFFFMNFIFMFLPFPFPFTHEMVCRHPVGCLRVSIYMVG